MKLIRKPRSVLFISAFFGVLFVALDVLIDTKFFYRETLLDNLFRNWEEALYRLLFLLGFLSFGLLMAHTLRKRDLLEEELSHAQEAAENERAKLEAILNNLGVGVSIQDLDYRITYENRFQQDTLGNNVGELCYKAYEDIDHICPHCPMIYTLKDGQTRTVEVESDRSGRRRYMQIISTPLKDSQGTIIAGIKVVKDITDIKLSEEYYKQSKQRLEQILDATPYGVVIIDRDQRIVHANREALHVMGYEHLEDIKGRSCHETLCPTDSTCPILDMGQQLDRTEMVLITRDGSHVPIIKSAVPIIFGNEEMTLEAFMDIRELKRAEHFIRDILENVDEGFLVIDRDYRIISANRAFCEQVKAPYEKIEGKHCYEVSHHYTRPCHEEGEDCPVRRTFASEQPYASIHVHQDSLGNPLYTEIKAYPMRDTSGNVISAIETINDITDKRKLEEQVRQSQKMEAIGTLTGGIAHDFNNILTAVMGFGEFLLDGLPPDDPLRNYVEMIVSSGERGAKLTQSLLAFSRKQIIHRSLVDLNRLITNSENLLLRLIGEDIEIHTDLWTEPLIVQADGTHIEQVLMNLATNARDAMPGGGEFFIATSEVVVDEHDGVIHGLSQPGRYALISVSDTGAGMDKETRQQIFEPFFTTKGVGKGTGLGLSVIYGIVSQHNGHINVYSESGEGTTFNIYLPLSESSLAPAESRPNLLVERTSPGSGTILVAEDDHAVLQYIGNTLRKAGYSVVEASSGEEAVEQYTKAGGTIDLLMLDVIMPRKNGLDAFTEIQALNPNVKAFFISGYPKDVLQGKGLLPEGMTVIQKPVTPAELLENIRTALKN